MDTFLETATSERGLNEDSHKVQDQKSKEEASRAQEIAHRAEVPGPNQWDNTIVPCRGDPQNSICQIPVSHRDSGASWWPIKSGFPVQFFQLHTEVKKVQVLIPSSVSDLEYLYLHLHCGIISQELTLGSQGAPSHRVFSMEELEEATKKFDISGLLDEGSIGKRSSSRNMEKSLKGAMAIDSVDVLERIASQLFTTLHEQQFNKEEIQVVSYPNKLFADMKSEPLSDASVLNMDVVINGPISGGISLMPSSLSQVYISVFQQSPEEFQVKLKYELLCNSKIAIIQLGFCILTLTELRCRLLATPNE
ncbi:hypothetical protein FXO37_31625 [Capsicum annuum]|nr:hypothetical protein FXO37_31625 [Capsicum annuum]